MDMTNVLDAVLQVYSANISNN